MPKNQTITKQDKLNIEYGVKPVGMFEKAIKDVDLEKRIVTGFYNSYNYFDSDQDVLLMGSAKNSIEQHGVNTAREVRKIKHAMNHNLTTLPGKIQVLEEKEIDGITGIYFETKMVKTTLGIDTLINYQEEIYDNHSIGFRYLDLDFIDKESREEDFNKVLAMLVNPEDAEKMGFLYLVKEIELFEGSTVAIGANQLTPYLGVKSGDAGLQKIALIAKISQIEKQLRNGKQSDAMMYDFSIQLRQIKQMINEMDQGESKSALARRGSEKSISDFVKELKGYSFTK